MSIYRISTLGEPDNSVTFNDYTLNPVFRVQSRAPRQFQTRDDNIPIPFESGISDFNTLLGQSIYAIQGTMYPKDEISYDNGLAQIRAACSLDLQQAGTYTSDDGYVPYTWGESTGSKTLFVKALYVQMTESTRQGFVQPFQILCKVKDPIIWGSTLKVATTQTSNPTTSTGAAKYPFQYPITFGSTLYTVTTDANNAGTIPAYPSSIDVYGPVTNPKITNTATGKYIQVNVTLNSTSDYLHIQYDKDTLIATLNGNSVMSNITTDSTQFKIVPGDNPIQLSGASVGVGSYALLAYRDSFALG
jgi:hypothetical protein